MDTRSIEKAGTRLAGVDIALEQLSGDMPYKKFQALWNIFLTSWKSAYTIFEKGSKISGPSTEWFAAKKAERLSDPLLKYLYEARNADEHGLEVPTEYHPGFVGIGVRGEGFSKGVMVNSTADGGMRFESIDGLPVLVREFAPSAQLAPIVARNSKSIAPPTHHLGVALEDKSPLNVARLARDYLARMIEEATALRSE
ncbi:MAG: hypothetical protein U1A24_10315 [Cypionkella sp.]|uniref:hypothetical protein n=1 Tax=Cypionkella sp. TaxID=2811411 RepID=UPI002AB90BF0|nr:hypothetical protein [Cypionkella sp.]MDZ4310932.1 hypothetical protein [Cypionkella sp.]